MAPTSPRFVIRPLLVAASLLLPLWGFSGPVEKNPVGKESIQVAEAHPMYLGTINSGIKGNDSYIDGNFSIVAPLWSTLGADSTLSGGLLFLEPYVSYGEGGEVAASLGLGYRHLFGTQSVSALTNHDGHQAGFFEEGAFIGANVFVDMLDTEADNQFWQLGVGLEAGTRYVEIRGNYYIPLSDRQLAEERRSRETFRTTRTSSGGGASSSVTPLSDPFATGNTVSQDALFTSYSTRITRTTTTTTTIERLFQRFEEGMEGWDAEIAVLVPGIDRYMDVMLIGGYYSFDNQPFGPQQGGTGDVEGWKAGIEVRPVPALVLSGTWYEDEGLTGSDWTAGVQLQLPFEAGDLGDGKGFWDRIGDAFTPRRRHLMERLAEPVGRQNAAVKIGNSFKESQKVVSRTTSTKVTRSTRVVSQSAQRVVLADDIVFVNNGAAVGNGIQAGTTGALGADGTAEHAYDNIVEGAATAGTMSNSTSRTWKVYTQGGTGTDYSGAVVATGSTKFISSFQPLVALGDRNFGGGTARPVLNGNISATGIPFMQVSGYDVRTAGTAAAIETLNVQELVVTDNITSGGTGIRGIMNDNSTATVTVLRNQLAGVVGTPGFNGIDFDSQGSSTINALVQQNELLGGFDEGIRLGTAGTGVMNGDVLNNTLSGAYRLYGVDIEHASAGVSTATVANNTLPGTYGSTGLRFAATSATTGSTLNATAQGNILSGTFTGGGTVTGMTFTSSGDSSIVGNVTSNQFSGSFTSSAVWLTAVSSSDQNLTISNNVFSGTATAGAAVELDTIGTASVIADVEDNTFSGIFAFGIDARRSNGVNHIDLDVLGNTFSGSFSDTGIFYSQAAAGAGNVTGQVEGNVLSGTFGSGVRVEARTSLTDVDIIDNELSGTFANGILLQRNVASGGQGKLRSDVLGNQLSGSFTTAGISVDHRGTAPADNSFIGVVDVSNNVLTGSFAEGIRVSASGGSQLDATVSNNIIATGATVGTVGIHLLSGNASILTVSGFDGNVVSGVSQTGILVERTTAGVGGAVVVNGTLSPASSNQVSNETGDKLQTTNPTPQPITGQFFLNGSQVTLPVTVP